MKTRLQNLQSSRSSGMNPKMNQVRKMMGDQEYEESKDMLQDMQKDINGSKKSAKKYAKNMIGNLDSSQVDEMSSMMKSKSPESAKQLTNILGGARKQLESKAVSTEKSNDNKPAPEAKIYIPAAQRVKIEIEPEEKKKAPKKQFRRMQMTVPKITELRAVDSEAAQRPAPKLEKPAEMFGESVNQRDKLNNLFSTQLAYRSMDARVSAIARFEPRRIWDSLQLHLLQNGGQVIKIIKIIDFPTQKFIGLPGSETEVESVPANWDLKNVLCDSKYGYTMKNNRCVRSENCLAACEEFRKKLGVIRDWLKSLESKCVGLESLCETLNEFGVCRKSNLSDSILCFHAYGQEYPSKSKVCVPQIPFVYIKFQ
jgi:hypothetical protein